MKYEIRETPSTGGGKIQVIAKPEKGKPFIAASLRWVGGILPQEMIMRQAVKIVENLVNFNNQ
jgi:hypothetical protein